MEKYRIREENKKFYPERYIKTLFGGYWTSEWHTMFILGEWCGNTHIFEFDTIDDCKKFLSNRQVKYHEI